MDAIGKTPYGTLLGGRTSYKAPILPIGARGGFHHRCRAITNASLETEYTRQVHSHPAFARSLTQMN
jgi:hypothetical protein